MPYCGEVQPSRSDWSRTELVHLLLSAGFHQTWFNLFYFLHVLYFSTHTFLSVSLSSLSHVGVHMILWWDCVNHTIVLLVGGSKSWSDRYPWGTNSSPEVYKTEMRYLYGAHDCKAPQAFCYVFNQPLPLNPHRWLLAPSSMNSREILASYFLFILPHVWTPSLSIFTSTQLSSAADSSFLCITSTAN